MSEDWLKSWYKETFSKSSVGKVKDETWEKINTQLEDWTGFWYKSNSEELEMKPKASTWESISANIPEPMQVQSNQSIIGLWLRVASIALIFIAIPQFLNDSSIFNYTSNLVQQETPINLVENKSLVSEPSTNQRIVNSFDENKTIIPVKNKPVLAINTPPQIKQVSKSQPSVPKNSQHFSQLPLRNLIALNTPRNVLNSTPKKRDKTWTFGLNVNLQQSQFINSVTTQGFKKSSSITNILQSNLSYSLSAFKHLKNKRLMKFEATLNNTKSQSYKDFVEAKYIEKTINLYYQTLSISYVQPVLENIFNRKFGLEFSSGLFASVRTGIEEMWDKESRYIMTEGFKKYDLGISFGLDGVYKLNSYFDFTAGIFYNNGIVNIFNGIENIPAHFLKTYTTSFGGTAGIRYNL